MSGAQELRERAELYIRDNRLTRPLIFTGYSYDKNPLDDMPIEKMIREVLTLSQVYSSYVLLDDGEEFIETYSNAWRSVWDIWRHIIFFKPEVSIFDVIESLGNNYEGLAGHYCCTVSRRVFHVEYYDDIDEEDVEGLYEFDKDELGVTLLDWADIKS